MKKLVIVINGAGTSGKDSIIEELSYLYLLMNESSIDPIKEIGEIVGTEGKKDPKTRKFLSDLKRVCEDYNEFTTNYLLQRVEEFRGSNHTLLFVHIREPEQIDKFVQRCSFPCKTVLVQRDGVESWGNDSDDNVNNYKYDYTLSNNDTIEKAARYLSHVIDNWLSDLPNIEVKRNVGENYENTNI